MPDKTPLQLTVARVAGPAGEPIIVVQVPWDEYVKPLGTEAYVGPIKRVGRTVLAVARSPGGIWCSATNGAEFWDFVLRGSSMDALPWARVRVEI